MEKEIKWPTTQMGAIQELRTLDHAFLSTEFTRRVLALFPRASDPSFAQVVAPDEFKGLRVPGREKGDKVYGADAADLADAIAESLGMPGNPMMGRGSRLRFACDYVIKKLQGPPPVTRVEEGTGKT